ncbi:MAG: hypothetical protein ACREQO_15690 [Candidatus Binatia bacterium]
MKLSISETRRRLPELVRRVQNNASAKIEITVGDEVVAELRLSLPQPEAGTAATVSVRRLLLFRPAPLAGQKFAAANSAGRC